jgi:hypothetical protein
MTDTIPIWAVTALIDLGRACDESCPPSVPESLRPCSRMNCLGHQPWETATADLSGDDHAFLAMGLVAAENAFRWPGGSVASGIWVYHTFARRFPSRADELAEWMLRNSRNPYIPFGTNRGDCVSLREYERMQAAGAARRATAKQVETRDQEKADAIVAVRARLGAMRQKVSQARSAARSELIEELRALPSGERIIHLALDEEHPLDFYPADLIPHPSEIPSTPTPLEQWAISVVVDRARAIPRGPWRQWFKSLPAARHMPGKAQESTIHPQSSQKNCENA